MGRIVEVCLKNHDKYVLELEHYVLAEITRVDGFYFVRLVLKDGSDYLFPMDMIERLVRRG